MSGEVVQNSGNAHLLFVGYDFKAIVNVSRTISFNMVLNISVVSL